MTHRKFAHPPLWPFFSKKLKKAIENPRHVGTFSREEAEAKEMRLVQATMGSIREGSALTLYLLIDESDSVIADAKFQVFGPSALIGVMEAVCSYLVRKTCAQMARLNAEALDKQMQDRPDRPAFPEQTHSYLNLGLEAVEEACIPCKDLMGQRDTPIESDVQEGEGYPGWELLNKTEQIVVIEEIVESDIRPYIELDAGGIHIVDLVAGKELIIAYEGACTTCYASTGATLSAIQNILRAKVSSLLTVTPDSSLFGSS